MGIATVTTVLLLVSVKGPGIVIRPRLEVGQRECAKTLSRCGCVNWSVGEIADESKFENSVSDLSWGLKKRHYGAR